MTESVYRYAIGGMMAVRVRASRWVILLMLLLFCAVVWGDVIYLNTGGVVKGKIVERNADSIIIITEQGNRTELFLDDIDRIEEGESVEEMYKEKLSKIKHDDADAHYHLAMWLKKVNYHKQAKEEFEKAIILDPNHEFARAELGYVKRKEGWILPKEESEELWVRGIKKSAARRGRAARKRKKLRFDRRLLAGLPDDLIDAADKLLGKDADARAQAYEAFAGVKDEQVLALVKTVMQAHYDRVTGSLEKSQKSILKLLKGQTSESLYDLQLRWFERWDEARLEALSVIYDREIYPHDKSHGASGQPTVNERVNETKKIWPYYDALVTAELEKMLKLKQDDAVKMLESCDAKLTHLKEAAEWLKERGVQFEQYQDKVTAVYRCLLNHRAGRYLTAKRIAKGLEDWECRLWFRLKQLRIRHHNGRVVKTTATAKERECIKLINDYRMELGRLPMEIDERLMQACRKHSQEMNRLGYHGHRSPTKGRESAGKRAKLEKYPSWVSENIAWSYTSPLGAVSGWYHSAGHHRNMMAGGDPQKFNKGGSGRSQDGPNFSYGGWRTMGCGNDKDKWTLLFGPYSTLNEADRKNGK